MHCICIRKGRSDPHSRRRDDACSVRIDRPYMNHAVGSESVYPSHENYSASKKVTEFGCTRLVNETTDSKFLFRQDFVEAFTFDQLHRPGLHDHLCRYVMQISCQRSIAHRVTEWQQHRCD